MSAIERFATKYTDATQIEVVMDAERSDGVGGQLPDRLAAEVFQVIVEGLNNVRRHTRASRAKLILALDHDFLIVKIENEVENGSSPVPFTPRSIAQRVETLGGQTHVEPNDNGRTIVSVEIPL